MSALRVILSGISDIVLIFAWLFAGSRDHAEDHEAGEQTRKPLHFDICPSVSI
jgi:hypothetical protein